MPPQRAVTAPGGDHPPIPRECGQSPHHRPSARSSSAFRQHLDQRQHCIVGDPLVGGCRRKRRHRRPRADRSGSECGGAPNMHRKRRPQRQPRTIAALCLCWIRRQRGSRAHSDISALCVVSCWAWDRTAALDALGGGKRPPRRRFRRRFSAGQSPFHTARTPTTTAFSVNPDRWSEGLACQEPQDSQRHPCRLLNRNCGCE